MAADLKVAQDNIKALFKKSKDLKKELATIKEERDILSNDQQHLIKEKTKLDFNIKDLSEELQGNLFFFRQSISISGSRELNKPVKFNFEIYHKMYLRLTR